MPFPRVGIIIINYKGREDTLECLRSVAQLTYPNFFAVLVCQPPDDGTADAARGLGFPWVNIIENGVNNGFSGGNNVGIRAAFELDAEAVFLLNNDTTVEPGLLEKLVNALEGEKVGVVGPKVLYYDRPDLIWATGGQTNRLGYAWNLRYREPDVPDESEAACQPVEIVVGCGLLAKRGALEKAGLLDERFFLYYEESDLCARIRRAGFDILTVPSARMWHKVSQSTGDDSHLTAYYVCRNRLLYVQKNGSRIDLFLSLLDALRLLVTSRLKGVPRDRQRTLARAVIDFMRGKFGKSDFPLLESGK